MQVSVYVCESREGMFEVHLLHSGSGEQGAAEIQTEISRRAFRRGRCNSISIKGIMALPLFVNLEIPVVVFAFDLN